MTKKDRWFFPTNTNNMRMIIAQGLVASPDGFEKYYSDALDLLPGWIPIYKNNIPSDILKKGVSERENLTPCIIEFELSSLTGGVKIIIEKDLIDIKIDDIKEEKVNIIYIPAPLPLSSILKILFENIADKNQFEKDAENRGNVILDDLTLKTTKADQKLFETESIDPPGNSIDNISDCYKTIDYKKVYSYGGLLLSMFYFAKNGNKSNEIYHSIKELQDLSHCEIDDIYLIYKYFKDSKKEIGSNPKEQIYNDLIEIAIKNRDFKEEVIELLESDKWYGKDKTRAKHLAEKLKTFEEIGSGGKTVSDHFKEAKTSLERTLIMLFLRENSEALIDYNSDIFNEDDYIQFAMMSGIRDQFIKAPKMLRKFNGLQNFISKKMAIYAHEQANSRLRFKDTKTPLTLMDMLQNNEFKKWFAKSLKIEDCFQTKIIIPKGDYELKVANSGMEIVFNGIVKTPTTELKKEKYFEFISKYKFKEYKKYFNKYQQVK